MRELDDLEAAFKDYQKPQLHQFLVPIAFGRGDTAPVEWTEDFLKRDLRLNDANELPNIFFSMSSVGMAYLLPIWIRETLNGNWEASCNIYICSEYITDPDNWSTLSSTIDQLYSRQQKETLGRAMITAADMIHFEDVRSRLYAMGLSLT